MAAAPAAPGALPLTPSSGLDVPNPRPRNPTLDMTDLDHWIAHARAAAANDAWTVAQQLPLAIDRVSDEGSLQALALLAHEVYGQQLAAWADGLKFLAALARLPVFDVHGPSGQAVRRLRASLALAANETDVRSTLPADDRVAVTALAAGLLDRHDPARAQALRLEGGRVA